MQEKYRVFSGGGLKLLAILSMVIDHGGLVIFGEALPYTPFHNRIYWIMRCIGRLAFPIFLFLLVEGYFHTKNLKKYMIRLFLFALISEIPYDLAFSKTLFDFSSQNVFWTLLISVGMFAAIERFPDFYLLCIVAAAGISWLIQADYVYMGPIIAAVLFICRNQVLRRNILTVISLCFEPPAIASLLPINLYNGKKGISLKYFFYIFYPLHLLLLYAVWWYLTR